MKIYLIIISITFVSLIILSLILFFYVYLRKNTMEMVEEVLNDYWKSLDKEEYSIAIVRFNAYKKKLFESLDIHEYHYEQYLKQKHEQRN